MAQEIRAILIVEIAGRPPAHVKETLKAHVGNIKNMKDVEYISEKISEPKLIDEKQDIYSCFAEIEVETTSLFKLMELIFDFMPSSVEVLEPENLNLNNQEATMFLNDLSGRLHKYDEIAKIAQLRNKQLFKQYESLQANLVKDQQDSKAKKTTKKK